MLVCQRVNSSGRHWLFQFSLHGMDLSSRWLTGLCGLCRIDRVSSYGQTSKKYAHCQSFKVSLLSCSLVISLFLPFIHIKVSTDSCCYSSIQVNHSKIQTTLSQNEVLHNPHLHSSHRRPRYRGFHLGQQREHEQRRHDHGYVRNIVVDDLHYHLTNG